MIISTVLLFHGILAINLQDQSVPGTPGAGEKYRITAERYLADSKLDLAETTLNLAESYGAARLPIIADRANLSIRRKDYRLAYTLLKGIMEHSSGEIVYDDSETATVWYWFLTTKYGSQSQADKVFPYLEVSYSPRVPYLNKYFKFADYPGPRLMKMLIYLACRERHGYRMKNYLNYLKPYTINIELKNALDECYVYLSDTDANQRKEESTNTTFVMFDPTVFDN